MSTIGDHIRKRRLDLGLWQRQVAQQIGVDESTITNWEKHRNFPSLRFMPRIIQFLGYDPCPAEADQPLPARLKTCRKGLGLSQKRLAKILRVDPTTVASWEAATNRPTAKSIKLIDSFLTSQTLAALVSSE